MKERHISETHIHIMSKNKHYYLTKSLYSDVWDVTFQGESLKSFTGETSKEDAINWVHEKC